MRRAAAFGLTLLAGCAGGSERPNQPGVISEVRVVNKTPANQGTGVAEVVVPLRRGAYTLVPNVRTEHGQTCQVHQMGATHSDGSLRYLRLEVPVDVSTHGEEPIELSAHFDPDPPFRRHPAVPEPPGVLAGLQAASQTIPFGSYEKIEAGPLSETYRSRLRIPGSMLWAELTVTLYSDLPHARWTLQWGISDDRTTALDEDPGQVALLVSGADVEVEYEAAKVLGRSQVGGVTTIVLHQAGAIGDGQSQLVEGRFVFSGGSPPRVFAMAREWRETNTFGPFGVLLPEIPVAEDDFQALVAADEAKHADHPWARPVHGCNPSPSSTGDQADFGTMMMRADVLLADPRRLQTILRSVYQEACRTTHFRELDVSRVVVANHPNLLTLTGRPKYEGSGNDMLGKLPNVWITNSMRGPSGQQWKGHDGQHLSINYLAGIALLTGNRFAREEIEHHCMLYLTGFTYDSGSWNDSPGASRQVGRSSLAAIWMWQVSGREEIRQRVIDRTRHLATEMAQHDLALDLIAPRSGNTQWYAWEEGNGATGLAAVYFNFGTPQALDLVRKVSATLTMNGFGKLSDGTWRLGYQLPIQDANGRAYVARNDPSFDSRAAGGGLTQWGSPAVMLAATLHPNGGVRAQATRILQELYGGPTDGLDEHLDWLCVHPSAVRIATMTPR